MNQIAIIICNYNGGDETAKCVDAVLSSDYKDVDIYIVDNASTDHSIKLLLERYPKQVTILYNKENLGGSGGFGRGLRYAMEKKYPFVMMIDNDAFIDEDTITKLHTYLIDNPEVGVVGAKIMCLNDPERIMDYAKKINFDAYNDGSEWVYQMDSEAANVPRECDYVAATASMIRLEALEACGGMDEEHFIYYDDIEMSHRIKLLGYKIVSLGTAKAWHKSNLYSKSSNTFGTYYLLRNQYRFFAKYIDEADIERFAEYFLWRNFATMYGTHHRKRNDLFDTTKYIFMDFLGDIRGKAKEGRISQMLDSTHPLLIDMVEGKKSICVRELTDVSDAIRDKYETLIKQMNPNIVLVQDEQSADGVIYLCDHVKALEDVSFPALYIDSHNNAVASMEDYYYFKNMDNSFAFFKHMYFETVLNTIHKIREDKDANEADRD